MRKLYSRETYTTLIIAFATCYHISKAQTETIKAGNWSDSTNWTSEGPPTHNDNVVILHSMTIDTDLEIYNDTAYCAYIFYSPVRDLKGGTEYNVSIGKNGIMDFWQNASFEGDIILTDNAKLYIRSGVSITVGGFNSSGNPLVILEENARLVVLGTITFNVMPQESLPNGMEGPKVPTILGKNLAGGPKIDAWEDITFKLNLKDLVKTDSRDSIRFSILTHPVNGTITPLNLKSGVSNYLSNLNFNGLDSLEFTVCASRNTITTCTSGFLKINVQPVNDPPIANNDTLILEQGTQNIKSNVISNDLDVDGDTLKSIYNTVLFTANGGSISIDNDGNINYHRPANFSGKDSVQYTIRDAGSVYASAYIYINVPADVFISKGFSPNYDGVNDTWFIIPPVKSPATNVNIFNRWGDLIYESNDYKNDWSGIATKGASTTDGAPEGTYYYVVDFKDGSPPRNGFLTIIR